MHFRNFETYVLSEHVCTMRMIWQHNDHTCSGNTTNLLERYANFAHVSTNTATSPWLAATRWRHSAPSETNGNQWKSMETNGNQWVARPERVTGVTEGYIGTLRSWLSPLYIRVEPRSECAPERCFVRLAVCMTKISSQTSSLAIWVLAGTGLAVWLSGWLAGLLAG